MASGDGLAKVGSYKLLVWEGQVNQSLNARSTLKMSDAVSAAGGVRSWLHSEKCGVNAGSSTWILRNKNRDMREET